MINPTVHQTGLGMFEENCREALAEMGSPSQAVRTEMQAGLAADQKDALAWVMSLPLALKRAPAELGKEGRDYLEIKTHIPPVLMLEDGKLVVKLMYDNVTVTAGVGDGSYFFSRVVELLLNPALRAAYEIASPND
jgi:hypothetical protein